jgi:hypothetical protein
VPKKQQKNRNLKLNNLHGTRVDTPCQSCNSILGETKGLKEHIGGHKINTPPGPDHTGPRGPAVNPSS